VLSAAQVLARPSTRWYEQRLQLPLAQAHRRLDVAVCAALGWPDDLADEEILAMLLALNLQRAKGE
jgi:hypothetical protein